MGQRAEHGPAGDGVAVAVVDRGVIRPIAICVFRRGHEILVGEGYDPAKGDRYQRPVGGSLRFGETSEQAVVREVDEEIGVEMTDLRLLGVLENIFTCEGQDAHEIVFVYEARFADESLYGRPMLRGYEECA
ncbi:MAG: NUDIX domain-containing protein, partial [Armatimonadia bacterium]|nr:NUDIX domain-containing protein [Armatimonadia bacterium]